MALYRISLTSLQEPQQITVVGDGRIGRAFAHMAGPRTRLIYKGQVVAADMDGDHAFPIIVATHCSDLESVLEKTCKKRWKDLVFVQNGMLQPWLEQHGLQENTQALLFMYATPKDPLQPKGPMLVKDGGRKSCIWGRWASVIVQIMQKGGLGCSILSYDRFLEVMVEKLLWSSIFWLLSDAHGGLSVGTIAEHYTHEVHELISELLPLACIYGRSNSQGTPLVVGATKSAEEELQMAEKLCTYSRGIPDAVPSKSMAISEFAWRNGWFLSQKVTPCHAKWLKAANVNW